LIELAAQASMSSSTFHHHFWSMTALSPLQYQKQLRLREARRLMLGCRNRSVSGRPRSPSQFSSEYNRLFGAPPLRDIANLRQLAAGERG